METKTILKEVYSKTIHNLFWVGVGILLTIFVLPSKTFPPLDERLELSWNKDGSPNKNPVN